MKPIKTIFCILLLPLVLSGCTEQINASDMAIVQAVGIDAADGGLRLSAQYLDLSRSTGSTDTISDSITSVASGEAKSISEAVKHTSLGISSPMFFGQNKLIVLGGELVREDISDSIEHLLRGIDSRPDVLVALSATTAEDILSSKERNSRIPADSLFNLIKNGEKNGVGAVVRANDLLCCYADRLSDIYLPVLKAEKDFVTLDDIAVFSRGRYALTLNEGQSLGFLIIQGKIKNGSIAVYDEMLGTVGVDIIKCRCRNSVTLKGDDISFFSDINIRIALSDVGRGEASRITPEDSARIERAVCSYIKGCCEAAFNACAGAESDALRINRYLARESPAVYSRLADGWQSRLSDIGYGAKARCSLGLISDNAYSS